MSEKSLNNAVYSGVLTSLMLNLSVPFLMAYAIFLGASNFQLGSISSSIAFFSLLGFLPGAMAVEMFDSRKKMAVLSLAFVVLAWLFIAIVPFLFQNEWFWPLILGVGIYAVFNAFSIPAWNSWFGLLIDSKIRASYFGRRNVAIGIAAVIALIVSVAYSSFFVSAAEHLSLLFAFSCIFGILAIFVIRRIDEPESGESKYVASIGLLKQFWSDNTFRNLLLFMLVFNFGIGLATPFWDAFMLRNLQAEAFWIPLLSLATALATVLFSRQWGKAIDSEGGKTVLFLCALGTSLIPFFWAFSNSPLMALGGHAVGRIFWAGFNIAIINYQIDVLPKHSRTKALALFAMLTTIPLAIAPFFGAMIVDSVDLLPFEFDGIRAVFLIAFVLRFASAAFVQRLPDPEKPVRKPFVVLSQVVFNNRSFPSHSVFFTRMVGLHQKIVKEVVPEVLDEVEKEIEKSTEELLELSDSAARELPIVLPKNGKKQKRQKDKKK